jgi:hypothetical protein
MTTMEATVASAPHFPLRYEVEYTEELSRWLIFVKWLLAIPHVIILIALGLAVQAMTLVALFAILFTRRYPRGLFDFIVGVARWNANVNAYTSLLRDEYPPFSFDAGQYPVRYELEYPDELNRWLPLVKWLLAIPHVIIVIALWFATLAVGLVAFFAILFTKRYPRGLFDFVVGVERWSLRVDAYTNLMRDEYPPFSLN